MIDDGNERSLRCEIDMSNAEGKHEQLLFLKISFKKLTKVSRSLENGGTSFGKSTSGIAEPLNPQWMAYATSMRLKQILTATNKSHRDVKLYGVELAPVGISE